MPGWYRGAPARWMLVNGQKPAIQCLKERNQLLAASCQNHLSRRRLVKKRCHQHLRHSGWLRGKFAGEGAQSFACSLPEFVVTGDA